MEFNEKLQELRKRKGLTQEELAEALYVSRTAISKWESGRGFPSIDSLKSIAAFYGVTVDELLSGDQLLTIAENDQKQRQMHALDLVFGLLDCCTALLLVMPLFGQLSEGIIKNVSLLALTQKPPYLLILYYVFVIAMPVFGVLMLALQNSTAGRWIRCKYILSLALGICGVILFVMSQQTYVAVFIFSLLVIKAIMLYKRR